MTDIVEGPTLAALSCGKPAYLVVLLHGSGGDGQSIIDHAINWAPAMPKAEFLAVEVPFIGADGARHWFDPAITGMREGVEQAALSLDSFLDEMLAKRRLPASHLALVGFSHGATLALHVGLQRRDSISAIVAFSGASYDAARLAEAIRAKPPTLLVHGEADLFAPFTAMMETKAALKAQGVPVKILRRPGLGHEMDDDGVNAAGVFLAEHVIHKPSAAHDDHDHH